MTTESQPLISTSHSHSRMDTASYLAAILPELAEIARKGHFTELGTQIDCAAVLADQALVKRSCS